MLMGAHRGVRLKGFFTVMGSPPYVNSTLSLWLA